MLRLILTISAALIASFSFVQRQNVYFLKNNGKYVNIRDSADYYRIVREPDPGTKLYNLFEFYKDGKKKLLGKSSVIDPPKFEGTCIRFFNNGVKQSITNYKSGKPVGDEYDFYPNGKPYLVIQYPDNEDPYNNFSYNFLIAANYDSLGKALVENGNGYYKGYDDKFSYINEEGNIKDGKRDGAWKGGFKPSPVSFTENYKDGELIDGTATFDDGTSAVYKKTRGTPPQFKGGLEAFGQYLSSSIEYPVYARQNNIQGKVIVSFVVEKDGKVTNAEVSKSVNPVIDDEAVRVIKNSPRWVPGKQFGRNVRVAYSVPVSFKLSDQ